MVLSSHKEDLDLLAAGSGGGVDNLPNQRLEGEFLCCETEAV